jgi:hypothetical protein
MRAPDLPRIALMQIDYIRAGDAQRLALLDEHDSAQILALPGVRQPQSGNQLPAIGALGSIFPITPKLRTTAEWRTVWPAFSPRRTKVDKLFSVTAR